MCMCIWQGQQQGQQEKIAQTIGQAIFAQLTMPKAEAQSVVSALNCALRYL